jgi:hypothetical protein
MNSKISSDIKSEQLKSLISMHQQKRLVWYAEEAKKHNDPEQMWEEILLPLWLYEMLPEGERYKYVALDESGPDIHEKYTMREPSLYQRS